jgi:hypothetical protein
LDNWIYGLALVALTLAIHAAGVTFMVSVLRGIRLRLEARRLHLPHVFAILVGTITAMGLLLAALHGLEAAFWAAVYFWLGALGSPEAAILYSVDTMATRGASGLTLQPHWQMMGALEATNGMLLFGISTAFIFAVMQFYNEHLVFRALPDRSLDLIPKVRVPAKFGFSAETVRPGGAGRGVAETQPGDHLLCENGDDSLLRNG